MQADIDNLPIEHNVAAQRFEATIAGRRAVAEYRLAGDTIIFTHTEVPAALEGRGIANRLVRTALEYARARQLTVVPLCRFVAVYIRRHTEYQPLLHPDYQGLTRRR